MKFTIIAILLLSIAVHADNAVDITCYGCYGASICLTAKGGGFGDGTDFLTTYNTCQDLFYPATFTFNCDSNSLCDEGCLITASSPATIPEQYCS